jgi:ABC-type transport system involved in cytochrome bd biosynthesis fused ATPase/permease subunit
MAALSSHSKGKIINMMTSDVQTVDQLGFAMHFLWIGTLETIVVLTILWWYIGVTIVFALLFTLLVIAIQMVCAKVTQILW